MAQSYKILKEDFVSNLSGGSIWEVNYVTAVAPAAVLLWSALQARRDFFSPYNAAAFTTDFLLNVGAILAATTVYSSVPVALNLLLIVPALSLLLLPPVSRTRQKKRPQPGTTNGPVETSREGRDSPPLLPERPFVTHYRGSMMVVTCVAILAVDFKVFPRRFAKVETWGTSLMDMGVGSFVFAAGLVSARSILKARAAANTSSVAVSLEASLRHSLPLLALGFVRFYSVKGLDYAEHVSEYGVHWNFFFTLALLPPFAALAQTLPQWLSSVHILALFISCAYQAALELTSLTVYVLTAPRHNLLSQNREGLVSFFGYLSIFLIGQAIGLNILPRNTIASSEIIPGKRTERRILTRLLLWSTWFSGLLFLATSYQTLGLRVSRRLANLPYVLWVSAFNCGQLAVYCAVEVLTFPGLYSASDKTAETRKQKHATSQVLAAFNRNGLVVFLLANLLTGLVNLSTDTLGTDRARAMVTLFAYVGILALIATYLHQKHISIKL
ncbi:MAG: hypothetical protein Q9220_005241 [cf. Caloplaca sp. 1 TL-2023]